MEIPRLVSLARDDRQGGPPGFRGKGRARVRRWDSLVERALVYSQKVIRCQSYLNTEQLAVGASRPVDGMRRNQRLPAAPRWGPGAAAPGREGVLKG